MGPSQSFVCACAAVLRAGLTKTHARTRLIQSQACPAAFCLRLQSTHLCLWRITVEYSIECPIQFSWVVLSSLAATMSSRFTTTARSMHMVTRCTATLATATSARSSLCLAPRACDQVRALPCCAMPCHAVPCHAVPCRAVP